jgi:cell division protein FtsQ
MDFVLSARVFLFLRGNWMIASRTRKQQNDYYHFYFKIAAKCLVFAAFIFSLYLITAKFKTYFPISTVKVYGVLHVDQQDLQQALTPLVSKGFFAIDVELIKDRLLQSPWVSKAVVQRVWPNQVFITVVEKKPIARWNDGLLSNNGEIFNPESSSFPDKLPQLKGPEGQHLQILQHYRKLSSLLTPLHFKIARLELMPDHSWNVAFDNGIKISMGYKDGLTRMGHFVKVYPKVIGNKFAEVEYIDLRYTNGLAVRWKTMT